MTTFFITIGVAAFVAITVRFARHAKTVEKAPAHR